MLPALARALATVLMLADSPPAKTPDEAPPEFEPNSPRAKAADAFALGEAEFAEGNFHAAAAHFVRAQFHLPHPDTLFNLGLAWREAGELMESWQIFERLRDSASTTDARRDAEHELGVLRTRLATLVVQPAGALVCLDGRELVPGPRGTIREILLPGRYHLTVDAASIPLRLEAGEARQVDAGLARELQPRPAPRRHVVVLSGIGIGAGGLGFSLGVAAAATNPPNPAKALGATAAVAGLAALGAGVTTLVLELRQPGRGRPEPVRPTRCPASGRSRDG